MGHLKSEMRLAMVPEEVQQDQQDYRGGDTGHPEAEVLADTAQDQSASKEQGEYMAGNVGTERCPCSVECHSQQTCERYFAFARNPEALPARYN